MNFFWSAKRFSLPFLLKTKCIFFFRSPINLASFSWFFLGAVIYDVIIIEVIFDPTTPRHQLSSLVLTPPPCHQVSSITLLKIIGCYQMSSFLWTPPSPCHQLSSQGQTSSTPPSHNDDVIYDSSLSFFFLPRRSIPNDRAGVANSRN